MAKEEYVLDFVDYDGKRYAFSRKNFENHKKKHPELVEAGYLDAIKNQIRECSPQMIFPCYEQKGRFSYYFPIAKVGYKSWYNTAKIEKTKNMYIILTIYRFSGSITELKYGESVIIRP